MKRNLSLYCLIMAVALAVVGCGHAPYNGFDKERDLAGSVVFGFFHVKQNSKDVTGDAVLTFDNGRKYKLEKDGFVVTTGVPGRNRIVKVTLPSGDYTLNNLAVRAGPAHSKTYFGNVQLNIVSAGNKVSFGSTESWAWGVANHWKEAIQHWNRVIGASKNKTFAAMAERTTREKVQHRAVATDRQQVETGF